MKILFVIVLYNQKLFDTATYKTLISGSEMRLFVYDNSQTPQHTKTELGDNIIYIHDPDNGGLSVAYNKAALYARKKDFTWLLLLDQDTLFSPHILNEYKCAVQFNPKVKLVVPAVKINNERYLSPAKIHWWGSRSSKQIPKGIQSLFEFSPINSGMLINVDAFIEVGGYNNKVKLDHSDYQFIERLRKKYPEFYIMKASIFQNYSNLVDSVPQKKMRYALFCQSLKNYETTVFSKKISCFVIVIKRAVSLIISTRDLSYLKILYKHYLR